MGPAGGSAIADGLLSNPKNKLKVCRVADNRMGDEVASQVAACMRGTTKDGRNGRDARAAGLVGVARGEGR